MNADYYFVKVCNFFAHFYFVIANSTGMNPEVTRRLHDEWNSWRSKLQLLEINRGC